MKSTFVLMMLATLLFSTGSQVFAQKSQGDSTVTKTPVHIIREGAENPFKEVAKSTMAGFGAGMVLAIAISLVADDTEDISKWLIFGGTFAGLAAGIHHVSKRPKTTAALLQFDANGLAKITLPPPQIRLDDRQISAINVNLASIAF
jgi:hypothetical protein